VSAARPVIPSGDPWARIRLAWLCAGALPVPGTPAWNALPEGDIVREVAELAERTGVRVLITAHGPGYVRAWLAARPVTRVTEK
jgi:hypothetical protein